MDISQLSKLGKVGGVPGIAIGAAVLIVGAMLNVAGVLPEAWRGPVFMVIAVGAVLLALLAVLGWARGSRTGPQDARTESDGSAASNIDRTKSGGSQHAATEGKNAPASNLRE